MRLRLPLQILFALLCMAANPIRAQTSAAVPEAGDGGSDSIVAPEPRAGAYQAPDPAGTFARPAYKSQFAALGMSVLGTAAPILMGTQMSGNGGLAGGLIIGGMLVGPSLGQFYAGTLGGGMLGVGIRTGGTIMTMLGFAYLLSGTFCLEDGGDVCDEKKDDMAAPLLILGTAGYLGGVVYSLLDAGRAVDRYNARQDHERVFGWSPTVAPTAHGGLKTGALAWMKF